MINEKLLSFINLEESNSPLTYSLKDLIEIAFKFNLWVLDNVQNIKI